MTVVLSVILLVAGVLALTQFNQELIPSVKFPHSVVLAFCPGATSEETLDQVTVPIEDVVRQVEGVVYVESSAGPGHAAVLTSSEYGHGQDAIRDEIRAAAAGLEYPEGVETPELLAFSLSDLPLFSLGMGLSERVLIASALAVVVTGGWTTSTFLTLLEVRVAYSLVESVLPRFHRLQKLRKHSTAIVDRGSIQSRSCPV